MRPDPNLVQAYGVFETQSAFGRLLFAVQNPRDAIQSHYAKGKIYEEEELALILEHFPGGHFLDVGANVGNHTVCIARLARTVSVTAIEPNPNALALLAQNVAANGLWDKVQIHNVALSDAEGSATLKVPLRNLGGASLSDPRGDQRAGMDVAITLAVGDALLALPELGFVKIDVEGHEIACLNGLRTTLMACKPPVFIEVAHEDRAELEAWFAKAGYGVVADFARYPETINLLFKRVD